MPAELALQLGDITHRYEGVLALDRVSVDVEGGSFTAILGPNGAGKSTLAMIMGGMLRPVSGVVRVGGKPRSDVGRGFNRLGIALVPEGRRLFPTLTVEENLLLGGYGAGLPGAAIKRTRAEVLEFLPELREHVLKPAGILSGGEQQIVAVARALMARPTMLILDEPSLGLAPKMVDRVYEIISGLNRTGVAIIVVEQIATHALRYASRMVILEQGRAHFSGPITDEAASEALRVGYFGHGSNNSGVRQ